MDASHPSARAWLEAAAEEEESFDVEAPAATSAPVGDLLYRRRLAQVELLESRNARDSGRLISRELVRAHAFGALNRLSVQLLRDFPRTLATRLRSPLPLEQSTAIVQDLVGSALRLTKREVISSIRRSRVAGTGEPPAVQGQGHDDDDPTESRRAPSDAPGARPRSRKRARPNTSRA
jgi:hypothetical protein